MKLFIFGKKKEEKKTSACACSCSCTTPEATKIVDDCCCESK